MQGRFIADDNGMFQGDPDLPPVLLHRPILTLVRSTLLGKVIQGSEEYMGLFVALCFGIKDGLKTEILEAFRLSGTSHVLALSGMHAGILVLFLHGLLKPFLGAPVRRVVIGFILLLYTFLVGPFPSLVRAVAMYGLHTLASLTGRKISSLDLLALTFLLTCLLFPATIASYSNLLSYAAVTGIFLFTPSLQRYARRFLCEPLLTAASLSLSAQIFTAPLSILLFSRLPLFGWVASILLSLPVSVFMWLGILSYTAGGVPVLNGCLQGILEFLYTSILYVANVFASAPAVQVP
ncbi:MAG: hypothetical protein Kow009_12180 [Spirochaetales bacterium]